MAVLAGDAFLKKIAETIFTNIRTSDICSRRYGEGYDEFIMSLPAADSIAAKKLPKESTKIFLNFLGE
jgi:GGDEF domain-containing protein